MSLRERYERAVAEAAPARVLVATKYVDADGMQALADAGVELVGENRLQDLVAKRARFPDAFRWHFIGHLQSRKARELSGLCELVHSLDSASAARRLAVPALVQVNLAGEASKSGVAPAALAGFLAEARAAGVDVRGLMTMPPAAADPEESRPYFRELARLAREHGLAELSMGTSQDWRVAVEEGATIVRLGSVVLAGYHGRP